MRMRVPIAVLLLVATVAVAPAGARTRALRPFNSCGALLNYARAHGTNAVGTGWLPTPVTFEGPAATGVPAKNGTVAPQAAAEGNDSAGSTSSPDFSTTNDQEAGVDEPDVVKTDGKVIYAIANGWLHAVDPRSDTPKLLDSLELDPGYGHQLFLDGNRLLVLQNAWVPQDTSSSSRQAPSSASIAIYPYARAVTRLTEIDVSDPSHLRVVKTERADGEYTDARLTGDTARIVIVSRAQVMYAAATAAAKSPEATVTKRRRLVRRAQLAAWRPGKYFHDRRKGHARNRYGPLVPCSDVRYPSRFSGLDTVTILTVDMSKGLPSVDEDSIMSDAQVVYGSPSHLYVATQRWMPPATTERAEPPPTTTEINEFDASKPDQTSYVATGSVSGFLLNQFALSEYKGVLRVASTDTPQWWSDPSTAGSGSSVTTLSADDLKPVGKVSGLGQGQRIYAVRFIDDTAYVVTFRQVDPLYTVDLSDPANPKVVGQLELEGYSSYLHPLGHGLLLGVGSDVGTGNEPSGSELSLFDVSDPAHPTRLAVHSLGGGSSTTADFDHHAFLYWPATQLAVMPVTIYNYNDDGSGQPFVGAIGFHVTRTGIDEIGRITHPSDTDFLWDIQRANVIGDRLFTMSSAGVLSSALSNLTAGPFVSFPDVPKDTGGGGCSGPPHAMARQYACPLASNG